MLFEQTTLGDVSKGGKGNYGIAASAVDYSDELYTYLRITDIKDDGTIDFGGLKSVNDGKAANYLLQPNDIVFARTGASTGRNYFYDGSDGQFVYAGFLIKFSIDPDKVNPKYVKYYCLSQEYKGWIASYNTGSTRGNINAQTLAQMPLLLPERMQQDKMVDILSSIDRKIKENEKINKNLEQQAEALFKAWFLDYIPWNGNVPSSWIDGKLGDFTDIKRGGSPRPIQKYLSNSGLRWLKISDVTSLQTPFVIDIKDHIIEDGLKKTVLLKEGSLVLSNSATPGIPKILDVDSCIHDGWLYFPQSKFSREYLYLYFKYIRQQLVNFSNGSVFNNLKTDILKNYPTILPDKETLQRFDSIVNPIFLEIQNRTRESHQLVDIRDALLPKLMSGELDVSDINL